MNKRYVVQLSPEERAELNAVLRGASWRAGRSSGRRPCWLSTRARAARGWADERVAEAYRRTTRSVERWRKAAVEDGPLSLVERKAQERPARRRLGGEEEARLVALACSKPPEGAARWTLRLLASAMVELETVDGISAETVRQSLRKTRSSPGAG